MTNRSGIPLPERTGLPPGARSLRGFPRRKAKRASRDSERDLLDELRRSLRRMKVLEGQGSKGKGYPTKVGRPSPGFARSPPAPKRSRRGPASPWRTVAALVVVGLLVAVATGWVLRPQSVIPGQPPDGSEPRWKDESATHFTFAAAGAFDGPGDANSVAVLERARAGAARCGSTFRRSSS